MVARDVAARIGQHQIHGGRPADLTPALRDGDLRRAAILKDIVVLNLQHKRHRGVNSIRSEARINIRGTAIPPCR